MRNLEGKKAGRLFGSSRPINYSSRGGLQGVQAGLQPFAAGMIAVGLLDRQLQCPGTADGSQGMVKRAVLFLHQPGEQFQLPVLELGLIFQGRFQVQRRVRGLIPLRGLHWLFINDLRLYHALHGVQHPYRQCLGGIRLKSDRFFQQFYYFPFGQLLALISF